MARVTSADVARESGVSRTTVSYVLNSKTCTALTDATRKTVLETAARMGYTPSAPAPAPAPAPDRARAEPLTSAPPQEVHP